MSFTDMSFTDTTPVRKYTTNFISEKWEIDTRNSAYSSFEFNHDMNYIAVKNNKDKNICFGNYSMPQKDIIIMDNGCIIKIIKDNDTGVIFSFSSADSRGEIFLTATKAKKIPDSRQLELLCRTWEISGSTVGEYIGTVLFISKFGTYLFKTSDSELNNLSQWRWVDDEKRNEFEYTYDNWKHNGRVAISEIYKNTLKLTYLKFLEFTLDY